MPNLPSVSFIVPSMNEEGNIENTFKEITSAIVSLEDRVSDFEVIFINDGSSDRTREIIEGIAAGNQRVRCIHHEQNLGFGAAYKSGVCAATKDYVFLVPGENTVPAESIEMILSQIGQADLIIPYPTNISSRKRGRQVLSWMFQKLTKSIFTHNLRYYNGPGMHRRELVISALPKTNGHAFQMEMLVKLLAAGHSYLETGFVVRERPSGHSKALRPKNVLGVLWTLIRLKLGVS